MRLTRNKVKRAVKCHHGAWPDHYGADGPGCPYCAPKVNGKLKRETLRSRAAASEITDALSN